MRFHQIEPVIGVVNRIDSLIANHHMRNWLDFVITESNHEREVGGGRSIRYHPEKIVVILVFDFSERVVQRILQSHG